MVAEADSIAPDASIEERNLQLSKLIKINSSTSVPHPEWTAVHDAVLLRALTKHGWLAVSGVATAVDKDETIRWGAPFEISDNPGGKDKGQDEADPETEKKFQADFDALSNTASRAVVFLQNLDKSIVEGNSSPREGEEEEEKKPKGVLDPKVVNEVRAVDNVYHDAFPRK